MIELPDGEDYGIAIKLGRYDERNLMDVLRYIENNYPEVTWWGDDKPTDFTPDLSDWNDDDEEVLDFVLFIERENELSWGSASNIYDEAREYDYIVYTAEEFVCSDIENEMDVSFLFNFRRSRKGGTVNIVIKCGESMELIQDVLEKIEHKMPNVLWASGGSPTSWNPQKSDDEEYYVALFVSDTCELTFTKDSKEYVENYISQYHGDDTVIYAEDFLSQGEEEIENGIDVSFLFNEV